MLGLTSPIPLPRPPFSRLSTEDVHQPAHNGTYGRPYVPDSDGVGQRSLIIRKARVLGTRRIDGDVASTFIPRRS
jgi:hypothetical protein